MISFKVKYHPNENPLQNSEKITYVSQRLMYPIINNNKTLPLVKKNAIKFLGFYIKNSFLSKIYC